MSNRELENTLSRLGIRRYAQREYIPAVLGTYFGGEQYVEVPNRAGYVYARVRNNSSETVQVYNDSVTPAYGLQVLITRDPVVKSRYKIVAKDFGTYPDGWGTGTSTSLPLHGDSHSFNPDNPGGDVVWVYPQQFLPMLAYPGTTGSVSIHPYTYNYNDNWYYIGGTGTSTLLTYNPTGTYTNRIVLVYADSNGNPQIVSGGEFPYYYTGTIQLVPYIPDIPDDCTFPIAVVRLATGTSSVEWGNLYDVRPFFDNVLANNHTHDGLYTGTAIYLDDIVDVNSTIAYEGYIIQMVSGTWAAKIPGIPVYNNQFYVGYSGTLSDFSFFFTGTCSCCNFNYPDPDDLALDENGYITIEKQDGSAVYFIKSSASQYKTSPTRTQDSYTSDYYPTTIDYTNFTPLWYGIPGDNSIYFNSRSEWSKRYDDVGDYTYIATLHGGIRLWVNDELVINNWSPVDEYNNYIVTGTYNLLSTTSDTRFVLEYFNGTGTGATLKLEEQPPLGSLGLMTGTFHYATGPVTSLDLDGDIPCVTGTLNFGSLGIYGNIPYVIHWDAITPSGTSVSMYYRWLHYPDFPGDVGGSWYQATNGGTYYRNLLPPAYGEQELQLYFILYSTFHGGATPILRSYGASIPSNTVPLSTGTSIIDFSTAVPAVGNALVYDGTYWSPGTVSGVGGGGGDILIYDDNTFIATGTAVHFNDNLSVIASGTSVWVDGQGVPTGTYYTRTELQTSGSSQVNWWNVTNSPALANKRIVQFAIAGTLQTYTGALRTTNIFGQTMIIEEVHASVNSAAFGTGICVDIHKNGTTIFTNQAHRPYITTGSFSGYSTGIDVPSWANNEYLTMDVDLIGSTTEGSDLVVEVLFSQ